MVEWRQAFLVIDVRRGTELEKSLTITRPIDRQQNINVRCSPYHDRFLAEVHSRFVERCQPSVTSAEVQVGTTIDQRHEHRSRFQEIDTRARERRV